MGRVLPGCLIGIEVMQVLSVQAQRIFLGFLLVLMAVTRGSHVGNAFLLPDASWAVFFLAGVFVFEARVFLVLILVSALIDALATTVGGVSNYCLTPAYVMMLPSYAVLWCAGRACARQPHRLGMPVITGVAFLSAAAVIAELISSGSFYYWNHVGDGSFLAQEWSYLPEVWLATLGYGLTGLGTVRALVKLGFRGSSLPSSEWP